MFKAASLAALVAGALVLAGPAFAISSESADDSAGGANITDPDSQIDEITSPSDGTDGSATIEVPPIDAPGDSDDYAPPESEDESGDAPAAAPADPAPASTGN
jgi:hypothetical protein